MIDKVQTGKNIKKLCIDKDVSLHKLSNIFGNGSTIYKWANGEGLPSVQNLFRLSKILDCSIYDIIAVKKECARNIDYCRQGMNEMSELYDVDKIAETKSDFIKWLNAYYEN